MPSLSVRLVDVAVFQIVPAFPVKVQVPVPIVIVRVFELVEENNPVVKLKLLALKVPFVKVKVLVAPEAKASCKVRVPPGAFIVMSLAQVKPAEVKVKVLLPSKV